MAGILDLDRNSFFGAMDELGIVGEQRDDLVRQYREKSSPVGLLMQAGETDPGMVRSDIMPFVRPEGMSLWDAWKSGDAEFATPGFLTGAVSGSARAFDAPGAAGLGLIPEQDMAGEALGVAGAAQLGGGAVTRPMGSLGMGGRVAGGGLPEPRNAAERMARDILDMRAAGRAGEVTDEMMAQADPQYMFYNTPLPMDEASRMVRAREAGFDTSVPLYHGGRDNLQNVSRLEGNAEGGAGTFYMTDERSVANSYAPNRTNPSGENIMHLLARSGDYREAGYTRPFPADGTQQQMDAWLLGNDAYNERMSGEGIKSAVYNQQINAARRNNQPGVVMRQTVDNRIDSRSALPSDVFIALDPANVRSRFARFDPEFAHLSNLSAANVDPLVGLLGVLAAEEQRRQRNSQ